MSCPKLCRTVSGNELLSVWTLHHVLLLKHITSLPFYQKKRPIISHTNKQHLYVDAFFFFFLTDVDSVMYIVKGAAQTHFSPRTKWRRVVFSGGFPLCTSLVRIHCKCKYSLLRSRDTRWTLYNKGKRGIRDGQAGCHRFSLVCRSQVSRTFMFLCIYTEAFVLSY